MPVDVSFFYALALKMVMTASIVVVASVAVERSGPFIGALIAALPTAAGAAYIILALEHPPAFICRERGRQPRRGGGGLDLFAGLRGAGAATWHRGEHHAGDAGVACGRRCAPAGGVDTGERGRAQRGGVRRRDPGERALPDRHRSEEQAAAHALRPAAARRHRGAGRCRRDDAQPPHRLVPIWHVRGVPDRHGELRRHPASAARRQGRRERAGLRAGAARRARPGFPAGALPRRAARGVVVLRDRARGVHRLERPGVACATSRRPAG